MSNLDQRVPVGVGVVLRRDQYALVGLRQGAHGAQTWAFPGGKPDPGEAPDIAAAREVYEETGLQIDPRALTVVPYWTYDRFEEERLHYVTLYFEYRVPPGWNPIIMEPHKCDAWEWKLLAALGLRAEWTGKGHIPIDLFPGVSEVASELWRREQ